MDGGPDPVGLQQGAGGQGGGIPQVQPQGVRHLPGGEGHPAAAAQGLGPLLCQVPGLPVHGGGAHPGELLLLGHQGAVSLDLRVDGSGLVGQVNAPLHVALGEGSVRLLDQVAAAVHGVQILLSGGVSHVWCSFQNRIFSSARRATAAWNLLSLLSGGVSSGAASDTFGPLAGAFPASTRRSYSASSAAGEGMG